ncbi:MAG: ABC transporter substrate-binding protein [Candidatus Vecturithrix sp.]|jgi:ABC-type amino acid transport substrate-binding protein|nr:ABC transporter substrate-binding protein [Candidatus Vecturithrix sp.]
MTKFGSWLVCIFAVLLLLAATVTAEDAMDQILARGKLVIGTEIGTPPWVFKDPNTGEVTGFTVELAQLFAEELGVELEINSYEWAGVIPSLLTEKVDMLAAPLTRTVQRSAKLYYTEPYVNMTAHVLVRKGEFSRLEEVNNSKVVLTCSTGSIWEQVAEQKLPNATVRTNPTNADNAIALSTKRADGYLNDKLQLVAAMQMYPDQFELILEPLAWDSFAFAVRYDSFKLGNTFDLFMRLIKMDGRYAAMFKKWLGYEWTPTIESAS